MSSELFFYKNCSCSFSAYRWLLVWSSLALSGWLWPVLPDSGLICRPTWPCLVDWLWPALHFIYMSLTWFPLEETLNLLLQLCLTFVSFAFFLYKIMSKKLKLNHQHYTNSIFNRHIIIWLKTKSFNVKLFLDIANKKKKYIYIRLRAKAFVYSIQTGVYYSTS